MSKITWVQTEKSAHELWNQLVLRNPTAAQVMHVLLAHMGKHNAVTVSQKTLAELTGRSERSVRRAVQVLREERWIAPYQLGGTGSVTSYVVNDRVAWSGKRDDMHRFSAFSSAIIVSASEQPDGVDEKKPPLLRVPSMYDNERQLPSGEGLPPISQPSLPGYEPDLPALQRKNDGNEGGADG